MVKNRERALDCHKEVFEIVQYTSRSFQGLINLCQQMFSHKDYGTQNGVCCHSVFTACCVKDTLLLIKTLFTEKMLSQMMTDNAGVFSLLDVNDNVPFFTSSIYEASVTEGAEVGTFVTQVSSNDLDLGLNGKVTERFGIMEIQTSLLYQHSYSETFLWIQVLVLSNFSEKLEYLGNSSRSVVDHCFYFKSL